MATTNMQMQTFVTQPDEAVEGFDGYNGDLTGDVAATLGVNCGMSTGRNGIMAFAANQRDEVRDLHDVAGALQAQSGNEAADLRGWFFCRGRCQRGRHWIQRIGCSHTQGQPRRELYAVCFVPQRPGRQRDELL